MTPKASEILPQIRSVALIALGSNRSSVQGDPREAVQKGIQSIVEIYEMIRGVSPLYSTPAFPPGSGPDFVNAVLAIETEDSPEKVIKTLHEIEKRMGRTRETRWGPRTLDLDLIALGSEVRPDRQTHAEWRDLSLEQQLARAPDHLILPHPRAQERAFVLVPLADVAPGWVHPVLGKTVSEMLAALPEQEKEQVVALQ
ncbi:MAG: 2-amino-4-hydroxy-6-hydroxymethyldihydropteridine diphosphokinase [Paracoccaceae bacterium]|nr:2-amino-4-hydroxy-6-hydroxymethyldihydropteridine diphosphokinase [Paracoccaceae bacterium]